MCREPLPDRKPGWARSSERLMPARWHMRSCEWISLESPFCAFCGHTLPAKSGTAWVQFVVEINEVRRFATPRHGWHCKHQLRKTGYRAGFRSDSTMRQGSARVQSKEFIDVIRSLRVTKVMACDDSQLWRRTGVVSDMAIFRQPSA